MEKVFLRVYNREIEGMIEGGQLDEAIAHCQHILKTFPMHVETYRLLGKTFLEARRYADAADIFERVLMAVPDDFVSHVGMSIIRDNEGNLDDAIWHMERAFEVQPSNSAIQGELRRLYGRRDGVEPSKIRLSRDALANMYSQGELFNQAIAEIRSVLAEDPVRPDLQVMLMRAYYRSGQKVEAAEIATTMLKKYPYCLDSLRVLVDVLPGTARAENTQVYKHRLFLLDPYTSYSQESTFSTEQIADSAVSLERLDYRPGLMKDSPKPDWASSLGIKGKQEKQSEPPPAWLHTPVISEKPASGTPEIPVLGAVPPVTDAAATIPDWMRSGGWTDLGDEEKGGADSGQGSSNEPIAKADIPDWLMTMAPSEINKTEENQPEETGSSEPVTPDGIPEWLKPIAPKGGNEPVQPDAQAAIGPASESGFEPGPSTEDEGEKSVEPTSSVVSPTANGEDLPDWLKSMIPGVPVIETLKETQPTVESHPAEEDDVPDWLKSITPTEAAGEDFNAPQELSEIHPSSRENVPDFLRSPASTDVTGPSNAISEPAQVGLPGQEPETGQSSSEIPSTGAEPIPDWLTGSGDQEDQGEPPASGFQDQPAISNQSIPEQPVPSESNLLATVIPSSSAPDFLEDTVEPAEAVPFDTGADSPGWLERLNDKQDANVEEQSTTPQDLAAEVETPGWLNEPGDEPIEQTIAPAQAPVEIHPPETLPLEPLDRYTVPSESVPDEAGETIIHTDAETKPSEPASDSVVQPSTKPASFEEDTMAWLERLSAVQENNSEKPLATAVESLESPILENQEKSDQAPTSSTPEEAALDSQEPVEDQDITITSWLNKVDVQRELGRYSTEQPGEEKSGGPVEELPEWLKDLESPATPVITPKVDDDLPEWLRHPITPVESESASEPETPTWMDENMQITGQAAPTMPDEWLPAEEKTETDVDPGIIPEVTPVEENPPKRDYESIMDETVAVAESEPDVKPKPVSERVSYSVHSLIHPPTLKQTGMLSPVPVQDKDAELLSNAQTILDQDSLDDSMKQYTKLIRKGRLLDEVIHDLREAIYRYPVDVIIWQTLGDAYMRTNHLQDALDAYTKAEELLR